MIEPVTSYAEALRPIRERVGSVLKIRYGDFDDLCGFAEGLSGKVLGSAQIKRFGVEKFFDAIRGVGLRIRLEEDPEQTAKMLARVAENYNPRQSHQARPGNHSHLSNERISEVLGYLANNKGGLTRLNLAVKQARSNRARRAAKAFWQKSGSAALAISPRGSAACRCCDRRKNAQTLAAQGPTRPEKFRPIPGPGRGLTAMRRKVTGAYRRRRVDERKVRLRFGRLSGGQLRLRNAYSTQRRNTRCASFSQS